MFYVFYLKIKMIISLIMYNIYKKNYIGFFLNLMKDFEKYFILIK